MAVSLMERLPVSIDRDWLIAQIDSIEGLSFGERIAAGKCLGRFDREAWSTEEVSFLGSGNLSRTEEIAKIALDHCHQQAPADHVRLELARIRNWLFPKE